MRYTTSGGLFALRIYVLMASLGIGLGAAILVGGVARFSTPSFRGPRNLVAWSGIPPHWVWGVAFLAMGLALIGCFGRDVAAVHMLRFGCVMYFFLAVSFTGSVAIDPRASMTGVIAYSVIGLVHAFLGDFLHARGWGG